MSEDSPLYDQDIALDDLDLSAHRSSEGPTTAANDASSRDTESVLYWSWAAACILLAAAIPLLLFPRLLLFLAEGGSGAERRTMLTPLESFLSLHIGILLVALAAALVLNVSVPTVPLLTSQSRALGHPLLGPLTAACTVISLISYNTSSVGSLGFLVSLGSATIFVWGFWVILFDGSLSISKKTGADKHTSKFLFGNKAAASSQKKEWKKAQTKGKRSRFAL
ncbi:hypothetical protein WOLCODRAFT_65358 [Wolfiporia cocos MD-104 SS10]|uniref:Uncharacterized protein n=1 Tax=Wolfiporia cocos (strain MD-104) TaxID=742152 RepID=A0A2H3J6X1_WOLCO|nr:hypothetical protein WOLCODRAFT_65358 [Wolfiporia cocos MD-104 SS10]